MPYLEGWEYISSIYILSVCWDRTKAVFTFLKVVGKTVRDIAEAFSCLTCLSHSPQIQMIIIVLH
jgi:hypothetical protein